MQVTPIAIEGSAVVLDVAVADTWPLRFRGLLGRPAPSARKALLITRCRAVHTLGMGYPIDVVFVSRSWQVVSVVHSVPPGRWKVAANRRSGAVQVLELRASEAQALGIRPGVQLNPWNPLAMAHSTPPALVSPSLHRP